MRKVLYWVLATFFLLGDVPAWADANADILTAIEGMKSQMVKMQQTIDQQALKIQQLESTKVLETPQPNVSVPAPAAMSENDWQKGIKDNIGKSIPWLEGVKYGGDIRLRYEAFEFYDKNNDAGSTGTAADRSRNRIRLRLRWGMEKDFGDDWKAGFRLATGSTTDPNSTNQTLGNSGYFNNKTFNVDRAYAAYTPNGLKDYGILKGVKIAGGKFENPFLKYSTPMVWDADVNPEGIYEQAKLSFFSNEENNLTAEVTAGQFIVNENAGSETDANLFAYGGQAVYSTYQFNTEQPVNFGLAGAFYDYTNWFQTISSNTASTSYLRTNSLVADNFRVLNVMPTLEFSVDKLPVALFYDYAQNLANVGTEDFAQSGGNDIHDSDSAWGVGLKLGKAKKPGSWEAFYNYYHIGANAVVAAFNDSDFGGPGTNGYTNRVGHKFGLAYQLTDSLVLNWTGYLVRPLHSTASSTLLGLGSAANEDVFRSQLDVVFKF